MASAGITPSLFSLKCGRKLAYCEYGNPEGLPVIYFHDSGSSRLECEFFHYSAKSLGYRLISIDRPGIGFSDFHRYDSASDFCQDVVDVADGLGIDQFAVMSLGSGGVFALSLAHQAPHRVKYLLNLSGIPISVFQESANDSYSGNFVSGIAPAVVKMLVKIRHRFFPDTPQAHIDRLSNLLCSSDRKALHDPRVMRTLEEDLQESTRQGYRGVAQDVSLVFRKLDFPLSQISVPVVVWQGERDNLSARSDSEFLVQRVPQAKFHCVRSRGRFFFLQGMDSVFSQMSNNSVIQQAA